MNTSGTFNRPDYIDIKHWDEWTLQSGIHPDLTSLNLRSLSGNAPYDRLFYSDSLDRLNTGRLSGFWLNRYKHLRDGGWWSAGVEPATDEEMEWGCFKPNRPRTDDNNKQIKYEHPLKTSTRAFFLRVPMSIAIDIAARNNLVMPDYLQASEEGECLNFWRWVLEEAALPVVITEGVKKAAALISCGYVAVALPGISSGWRADKDSLGNRLGTPRRLIPELELLTTAIGRRSIYICFDKDTKQKTIKNVNKSIAILGGLLEKRTDVYIVNWNQSAKGVDDLINTFGKFAFDTAYKAAKVFKNWHRRITNDLTYDVNLKLEQRYLGTLPIPQDAKLICLKSPKGTGKTETIAQIVSDAMEDNRPCLVITHRVQLGEALCDRFKIPYVTQVREFAEGKAFGFGLCIDSLHPNSQARFNAEGWSDAIVILDECEQVIWHLLSAATEVRSHRVTILSQFAELIRNCLNDAGQVILSDADLSDVSIDYIKAIAGFNGQPWLCVNTWHGQPWKVYNYTSSTPAPLVQQLEGMIRNGQKLLIHCSGQKVSSKFGTQNLEAYLQRRFPELQILRVDSETVSDPSHAAYGCIDCLNEVLPRYDVVIASPSIETGVSIDIRGHFDCVFGIFQGIQPDNSVRQTLARLREPVDRYVWIAPKSASMIGNGGQTPQALVSSQKKLFTANVALLAAIDFDLDGDFDTISLRTWAVMAARINAGKRHYREAVIDGLLDEGHTIFEVDMPKELSKLLSRELKDLKDDRHIEEAEAEAASDDITANQYEKLAAQKAKTKAERLQERKYKRGLKYGVDVDAELILKDDAGWFPQIQLHYYLTLGRDYVTGRDNKIAKAVSTKGQGRVWIPDFNRTQIGAQVKVLETLGILDLLDTEREYRGDDDDLIKLSTTCKAYAATLKTVLGVTIAPGDSPIKVLQTLLSKLGIKLRYLRREGTDGNRTRVYGYSHPLDGREEIYAGWFQRDKAAFTSTPSINDLVDSDRAA